ncbi:hypothetical protein NDA07_02825 [Microcoleus vaginatus DQ-U2]|uniref:hypothetical protein n=1 Tax=Microcoleus vaginatus TaxID=119532 RepID=UPI0016834414|nr:hypothetical protein [Microcoleus sp. FACHB-DQ6]
MSRLGFNHRNLECKEGDRIVVKPVSAIASKLGDRISVIRQSAISNLAPLPISLLGAGSGAHPTRKLNYE